MRAGLPGRAGGLPGARTLPRCRRVEFAGLDHGGSGDVTSANRNGKPEVVAAELPSFLTAG